MLLSDTEPKEYTSWDIKDQELDAHDVSPVDTQSAEETTANVSVGDIDGDLRAQLAQARQALKLAMEQIYLMSMTSCSECLARHLDAEGMLEATGGVPWYEWVRT